MVPFEIPGYAFDGKRYFKLPASGRLPPAIAASTSAVKEEERAKKRIKLEKPKRLLTVNKKNHRDERLECHPATGFGQLKHQITARAISHHLLRTVTVYPDCLPIEDTIDHISVDENNPEIVRIGGSSGSIATGNISPRPRKREDFYFGEDEGWRTSWFLPSRITSLQTCGDRILATCIGPPAQALVGTTNDNISLASVTLVPRKTSIWTSALSSSTVALGCDKKVLISKDPARHVMSGYQTGGKGEGGAIFALDLTENLVFAGTRKGEVKIFDQRSSGSTSTTADTRQSRAEINFAVSTSVTNVRRINDGLVVACLDGSLATYDLRYPSIVPSLAMKGHVNQWELGLGFDIWKDEFLAAGGQDNRVRIWSLRTGALLPATSELFSTRFESPIKALRFTPDAVIPGVNRTRRDDGGLLHGDIDRGKIGIWIGDGGALRNFVVGS